MKNWVSIALLFIMASCHTAKIKNHTYETTTATAELGAIGHSKTFVLDKDFASRVYPKLNNKIRLDVQIVPFNKKLHKSYTSKKKFNQSLTQIKYIDSLPIKPEFVTISFLDSNSYTQELNAEYNQEQLEFTRNAKSANLISSIALAMDDVEIQKIKQADAYYLINNQDQKYTLALYKLGKEIDVIDMTPSTIFAYQISKFCWSLNSKGKWQVADINEKSESCKGETFRYVKEKKQARNLYKM